MDLIQLVLAIEQRISGDHLEKDTAIPPNIHLMVVVAISHEAFGCPVPSRRYVLGVWMLAVYTLA